MFVGGAGSKGRLEGCEIAGNARCGVYVQEGGDPTLVGCSIHDHAAGRAAGIFVHRTARGKAAVGVGNVFLRNEGGDVVRQQ